MSVTVCVYMDKWMVGCAMCVYCTILLKGGTCTLLQSVCQARGTVLCTNSPISDEIYSIHDVHF